MFLGLLINPTDEKPKLTLRYVTLGLILRGLPGVPIFAFTLIPTRLFPSFALKLVFKGIIPGAGTTLWLFGFSDRIFRSEKWKKA
jgi:hypothetical protein